jgi:RNA polymerase sigma-70 factor (ECF subfamily)
VSTVSAVEIPERAFEELYERNADRIFAFCRRRLRSRQEAEDAVQETFVAAMRAIRRGSVPVCESAWLHKIAENVCFAVYRSRRHVQDLTDAERLERLAARDSGADSLFGLEAALASLPRNQRHAFVLRELRGLSYKEIAIQLGVSVASVETLIYRARRGLARGLENGAAFRDRLTASLNIGSLLAAAKSWFAGATALKAASAAAVVVVSTATTFEMTRQHSERIPRTRPPTAAAQRAGVDKAVLWGARRDAEGSPVRSPGPRPQAPQAASRVREPSQPLPARPQPARPGPRRDDASPVPVSQPPSAAAPPAPAPSPPAAEPGPTPLPAPHQPAQPALGTVAVPALPDVTVETPPLPEVQPLRAEVPDVGSLLPAPPQLP